MKTKTFDVIVIGGGAAGLMCAAIAGKRGKSVLLLEHQDQVGKKILISGGGRCNFTNMDIKPECYVSENIHYCKSALRRYTQHDFISLVERHGISYHEKKLGQLFCNNSSKQIVSMLLGECSESNVEIRINSTIREIQKNEKFTLLVDENILLCNSLVIATGGMSIPKMGATDFGLRTAKQFGVNIVQPYPALVPLLYDEEYSHYSELAGVSSEVGVHCGKVRFDENILFAHKSLTGPAILQISTYAKTGDTLFLEFLSQAELESIIFNTDNREKMLHNALSDYLPSKLSKFLCETAGVSKSIKSLSKSDIVRAASVISSCRFQHSGTAGFGKAEAMGGGVDTNALSSKTMEATAIPNLFFIGEAVDVVGWLGGYNFQWAWSSGWVAGQFA